MWFILLASSSLISFSLAGLKHETTTEMMKVDGSWGKWTEWNICSKTCGGGSTSRRRTCDSPAPAKGGSDCVGEANEEKACNAAPCPGQCSTVSGADPNKPCFFPFTYHGKTYTSCTEANHDRPWCSTTPGGYSGKWGNCADTCQVDGSWGRWSHWFHCDKTCGGGTQKRRRYCDKPAPFNGGADCAGERYDSRMCAPEPCPVDGAWGEWTEYEACSKSCGGGTQARRRSCNKPAPAHGGYDCRGEDVEVRRCGSQGCPRDGCWGEWKEWSKCSKTCGGGLQERRRPCDNPAPFNGGNACKGDGTEERQCNTDTPCPVDGCWGMWTEWPKCSKPCGGGTQERTRVCDNPAPENGGKTCAGHVSQQRMCNKELCSGDDCKDTNFFWCKYFAQKGSCAPGRQYHDWMMMNCVKSCGYCAGVCHKDAFQGNVRYNQEVGTIATWGPLFRVTLDLVIHSTLSFGLTNILAFKGAFGANDCTEYGDRNPAIIFDNKNQNLHFYYSSQSCGTKHSSIKVEIGHWNHIEIEQIEFHGKVLFVTKMNGELIEQVVNPDARAVKDVSVYTGDFYYPASNASYKNLVWSNLGGSWGEWSEWFQCTSVCGGGITRRHRACNNPTPAMGGGDCVGEDVEEKACNTEGCKVSGGWGDWSFWSPCKETCDGEIETRTRACDSPARAHGGADCQGDSSQQRKCDLKAIPRISTVCRRNHEVGKIATWGPMFNISFDLTIHSQLSHPETSILAFKKDWAAQDCKEYGDRNPAVYYNNVDGNLYFYKDCDGIPFKAEIGQTYKCEIIQCLMDGEIVFTLNVDGATIAKEVVKGVRVVNDVGVYAGDCRYPASDATIENLIWQDMD